LFNIYEEKEINYVLEAICEYLYEYIKKYNSWNVKLVYNKIVKAASFKSEIIDIFDFDKYFQNEKKNVYTNLNDKGKEVKIIKNKKELCEQIIKMYFKTIINAAVNESIYNENLSRLYSMSNACDSAQDMLNDLVVSYNKVRHDHITKQISEIISSFEAGKTYE
jgi:F-type H+-transporting ATPase subunit gamma